MQSDRQNEIILVVDGDIVTRTLIADYLRHCGYRVVEAHDAHEAQQALQQPDFGIDIMLSDVDLPGKMNGFQLAAWVRALRPEITVLLSAAPERTANVAGSLCEEGPRLSRPYDPAIVVDYIKRIRGRAKS